MATPILTKKLDPVLSCHQGLSVEEIVYDCLEKAKALVQVSLTYECTDFDSPLPRAYLALLDDILELGLKHAGSAIDVLPGRCRSFTQSGEVNASDELVNEVL
jgi:hypothetical protein